MPDSIIRIDDDTIIRPARIDDAQEAFELIESNREHLKGLNRMSHIQNIDDERAFLEKMTQPEVLARRIGGLIEKDGKLIGGIGLGLRDGADTGSGELGYWLAEHATGSGIVTNACRILITMAFDEYDIHRVIIRATRDNKRSRAVAERLGFTFEGYQREALKHDDGYHDSAVYSLLSHERGRLG